MRLESKILLAVGIGILIVLGLLYRTDLQMAQERRNKEARIEAYVPMVVTEVTSKQPSYKIGETIVGVFTGERFTSADSVLTRQMRCSSGFEQFEEPIPLAGIEPQVFDKAEVPIYPLPDEDDKGVAPAGQCRIRFSETFNEIVEEVEVTKTATFEFTFKVEE